MGRSVLYITEADTLTSYLPPKRKPTDAILVVRKGKDEFEYRSPSNDDLTHYPNPEVLKLDQLWKLSPNQVVSGAGAIVELTSDTPILTSLEKDELD